MKLHPLHPASVHLPIGCIVLAPLSDVGAALTRQSYFEALGALMAAGAVIFGLMAASLGAMDFERAYEKAPKSVLWHAILMSAAVTLDGASAFGRFAPDFTPAPAPFWSILLSLLALGVALAGGYLGGELIYRHGVNVGPSGAKSGST